MSAYVVTRWKRYGHDRLYVAVEGEQVGYYDLLGDTAWATNLVDTAVVDSAAADWKQANMSAGVDAPTGIDPPPAPDQIRLDLPPIPSVLPGGGEGESAAWADLSSVRPGASARAQAEALRDAAPVRTFFARALGVKTNERAWRIGADGEEAVATQLAKRGPRWHVLHAVPVGARSSDIDHVVIGPAGVGA